MVLMEFPMFNCSSCASSVGPRVPQTKVTVNRTVTYVNQTEDGEKITTGSEIEKELALCPRCSGIENNPRPKVTDTPKPGDEVLAPALKFSIAVNALNAMIERNKHTSKRAKADFYAAYEHLNSYKNRGGGL